MAFEGTLRDLSLSDLLRIFRAVPKSGVLLLAREAQRGVIYVAEERPIDAVIFKIADHEVVAMHDEAVLQMLSWDAARFVFRPDHTVCSRTVRIEHGVDWLIAEGARRRIAPAPVLPTHALTLDTQIQLSLHGISDGDGSGLDVARWRILIQAMQPQRLRDICAATGIEEAQALRDAAELLSIGLLEIVSAPSSPSPSSPAPVEQPPPQPAAQEHGLEQAVGASTQQDTALDTTQDSAQKIIEAVIKRIRQL